MRIGWIVAANGAVVFVTAGRLFPELLAVSNWNIAAVFQFTVEVILEIVLPIAGIVAEISNSKYSQRLNIGYPILASCWWVFATISSLSNPFWGLALIFAVGFLLLSGITFVLYRATEIN